MTTAFKCSYGMVCLLFGCLAISSFLLIDAICIYFLVPTKLIMLVKFLYFINIAGFLSMYLSLYVMMLITPILTLVTIITSYFARRTESTLILKRCTMISLAIGYILLPLSVAASVVNYRIIQGTSETWGQFENFDKNQQHWDECAINLPGNTGKVIYLQRHNHPFLAEYDRKVRFETKYVHGVTESLPPNTGGKTKINVYWFSGSDRTGPILKFEDRYGTYYLDIKLGIIMTNETVQKINISDMWQCIGRLDGTKKSLQFITQIAEPVQ